MLAARPRSDALEEVGRLYEDFEAYCETVLMVEDKQTQRLIPFRLKPVQRMLAERMIERWRRGAPLRWIVLKARREGVSTLVQAFFFWIATTRERRRLFTIAHDDDTASYLHGMSERFFENLPDPVRPARRTSKRGEELEFANPSKKIIPGQDPGLNSSLRTVSRKNAGTGKGAIGLHISELAKWGSDAPKVLNSILQTVPRAGETAVIIESTAEGVGNEFHRRWLLAEQGISEYEAIFIPWFEEPTNRERPPRAFLRTQEEEWLAQRYGLDDGQLYWRRLAVENECGGSLDTFHQEYPAEPAEAFLSTGRPYFNMRAVQRYVEQCDEWEVWQRGRLIPPASGIKPGQSSCRFEADPRGELRMWAPPDAFEDYLIFADASEGSGGDFQCAYVMPRSDMRIVACWHGRVDREEYGDQLYMLGKLYGGVSEAALIAVEISGGWGQTPLSLLHKHYDYPRLYRRRPVGKRRQDRTDELGWDTTIRTRPLMLDSFATALRKSLLECGDRDLFIECSTFAYDENGKPQAQPGTYDDRVIAAAGAVYLWQTEPRVARGPRRVVQPREPLSSVTGY